MAKKILAMCMALVAMAIVPASASAFTKLVEGGTLVPTGTKIAATNVGNTVMTTSLGSIECTSSEMTGTVTANGAGVEGNIETASFKGTESGERCSGPLGAVQVTVPSLPWCIKTTKTTNVFELRGGKCSEASKALTFSLHTSFGTCNYQRTAGVTGSMTNTTVGGVTNAHLTASKVEFVAEAGNPFGCPSKGELDMTYKLETTNGTALQWG